MRHNRQILCYNNHNYNVSNVSETMTGNINRSTASDVRRHYYRDEYVVIAPRRSKRPARTHGSSPISYKTGAHHSLEITPSILEIPDETTGEWSVKVVANDYPAFEPGNARARGKQEVVLETPRPNTPFFGLSVPEVERILTAYQYRILALGQDYSYMSVFKNQGGSAGATLDHTHSQIIATDLIPPEVKRDRDALTQYQYLHHTSALCDVIRWELTENSRVVASTRYTTTVCPYSSRFPLEAWIIPHRQAHSVADLSSWELHSVADHLKGVVVALGSNGIDFNYHLAEHIPGTYNHFLIRVIPRITPLAGFELNTDVHINPVSPEYATTWYQQHIKVPDTG